MKGPQTLQEAIKFFSDYENCRQFMIAVRWADAKVRCPYCGSEKVAYLEKARLYRCYEKHPKQKFSLKIGTVFEDSPIGLEKWLPATWLLSACRNGISSYEIGRALGVTQKSAWFMMHRIRLAMQTGTFVKMGGPGSEIESDETFVGGRAKNMSAKRRAQFKVARETSMGDAALVNKTAIWGVLDREQRKVRATVVPKVNRASLQTAVLDQVAPGSKIYTDEAKVYRSLPKEYTHEFVNHVEKYVNGRVYTNGLENFWSLLKRGLNGTYVAVEPFHLHRYLDEQMFRYNNRKDENGRKLTDAERFGLALSQIVGKRLTFAEVTGKVEGYQDF
ncbi:MAG: IS1595 family transposase [Candidatus Sulfotelmatobacter sp.]